MKGRIYFFANFGDFRKVPHGGGEVGNRKTLEIFRNRGYEVVIIPKYRHVENHSLFNCVRMFLGIVGCVVRYLWILIWGNRKKSVVHISGFYWKMIYFEFFLIRIAKLLGYKVVYEMRGGGADYFYATESNLYRKTFDASIRKADVIFSQGLENRQLIERIEPHKEFFYYPNYIKTGFSPVEYPVKREDEVNLIYFGRIAKLKNVDLVVDLFLSLSLRYSKVHLDIVGDTTDYEYYDGLKKKVLQSPYADNVRFLPACEHDTLKNYLADKHFFIFPTENRREGHSNALTEAMSWGIVPLVNDFGFNKSVVGCEDLVVERIDINIFYDKIVSILDSGRFRDYSEKVFQRINNNYKEEKVAENVRMFYDKYFQALVSI